MKVFFDSSALAKRYITERGTAEVLHHCHQAKSVLISAICPIEIVSGMNRIRREGKLSSAEYKTLKAALAEDVAHALIVPLQDDIVILAMRCLEKSPLRTLDAIHVASAKICDCDLFVSADRQQTVAAALAGLEVELVG